MSIERIKIRILQFFDRLKKNPIFYNNRYYILIGGLSALIYFSYFVLSYISSHFIFLETINSNFRTCNRYSPPFIHYWEETTIGLIPLETIALIGLILNKKNYKFGVKSFRLMVTLYAFFMFFIIIIILIRPWFFLVQIPYLWYRYFIYLDMITWILYPFSLYFIQESLSKALITLKNIWKPLQTVKKSDDVIRFIIGMIIIAFFINNTFAISTSQFRYNETNVNIHGTPKFYYITHFYNYISEDEVAMFDNFKGEMNSDEILYIMPHPYSTVFNWVIYAHFYEQPLIDSTQAKDWYEEFTAIDCINATKELDAFYSYLHNETKILREGGLSFTTGNQVTNEPVRFLFVDNYYDRYHLGRQFGFLEMLDADPRFEKMAQQSSYYMNLGSKPYDIAIFRIIY